MSDIVDEGMKSATCRHKGRNAKINNGAVRLQRFGSAGGWRVATRRELLRRWAAENHRMGVDGCIARSDE
jgi:hypothetical protein